MKLNAASIDEWLLGLLGTGAPTLGVVASWQENIEWGMRIASLAVGIAVGVLTLMSLNKKRK